MRGARVIQLLAEHERGPQHRMAGERKLGRGGEDPDLRLPLLTVDHEHRLG